MQRQIKSCTHCRQHKVRCDASKFYPNPCTRCSKFHLACVIDQNFKPRKGGQVEILREHLAKIQEQIYNISRGTKVAGDVSSETDVKLEEGRDDQTDTAESSADEMAEDEDSHTHRSDRGKKLSDADSSVKRSAERDDDSPVPSGKKVKRASISMETAKHDDDIDTGVKEIEASVAERMAAGGRLVPVPGPYRLEELVLPESRADSLHNYFMENCAPYIPIFESTSAGELYARSEFLFWAVMVTSALGEPSSELYISLVEPVKRLAAKKSLLATTRSSSVVQALLVLSTWPLPSEKILEDMSPRYASLAYSMGLQLGIHRGKFIYEFSRNQQLMPNAVKWRSRTWVQTYITQQMVSAASGIPPSMPVDYIIDHVLHDEEHPLSPRTAAFLKISMFYSKLVSIMGSKISSQDGLMDPESRSPTLDLLRTDLYTMFPPSMQYDDPVIEIMFLYARCIMDNFAFLPETPLSYQTSFIVDAFQASTRIVTLVRKLVGNRKVMEFPSFIRNPCNYAALTLFRLQSMPQIPRQYVASARESVVTVHRMYRNIPKSWLDSRVNNDISRIAKILESLNHVMMIHPELLRSKRVMRRMRSHLTFSLFYELVYIIHEARRRNAQQKKKEDGQKNGAESSANAQQQLPRSDKLFASSTDPQQPKSTPAKGEAGVENSSPDSWAADDSPETVGVMHQLINTQAGNFNRDLDPLPLFNNIDRKSYISSTVVSPNGTTLTKLVPNKGDANNGNEIPPFPDIPGASLEYHSRHRPLQDKSGDANGNGNATTTLVSQDPRLLPKSQIDTESANMLGMYSGSRVNGAGINGSLPTALGDANDFRSHLASSAHLQGPSNHISSVDPSHFSDANEPGIGTIFDGLDWMNTEGDDFLGWMLPRNE